jgi:hypothetical protein
MNQWDPSFGRRIICKKPTEEGDPAATEKRMGTRSTRHRRLSQRLPTISVHPGERNANSCGHPKCCERRIMPDQSSPIRKLYVSVNTSWIGTGKRAYRHLTADNRQLVPIIDAARHQQSIGMSAARSPSAFIDHLGPWPLTKPGVPSLSNCYAPNRDQIFTKAAAPPWPLVFPRSV